MIGKCKQRSIVYETICVICERKRKKEEESKKAMDNKDKKEEEEITGQKSRRVDVERMKEK